MEKDVLTEVTKSTNSDVVLFFIVVAVVLLVIAIPLYKAISASSERKLDQYIKREQIFIGVVKDNSSVISKLTTLIENNNQNCAACKLEQTGIVEKLVLEQTEMKSSMDTMIALIKDRQQK